MYTWAKLSDLVNLYRNWATPKKSQGAKQPNSLAIPNAPCPPTTKNW
ncbi:MULTISPECIES: hypothetical protein [Nostoc]|uniref:Uncharacterized protein n=1 Tax=Nostoc paludosum FACHB-159 TaxID=2692908 RepID=A0ABR8KCY4_9NOSO|nr:MULTISPECIES: hypothetical protein [Nostoc]MBD2683202.1 hypothetical protein [Nostoc sp. FACHB-857]MBD2735987.1 hypothetical protein [Nostoc paludosum FACHB-159]